MKAIRNSQSSIYDNCYYEFINRKQLLADPEQDNIENCFVIPVILDESVQDEHQWRSPVSELAAARKVEMIDFENNPEILTNACKLIAKYLITHVNEYSV
jgi:hypothetical protein